MCSKAETAKEKIKEYGAEILSSKGMQAGRTFRHHGRVSVYRHTLEVAEMSIRITGWLGIRVNERALIRGALLHDFYLYDWHNPSPEHKWHGFVHPGIACKNADREFAIDEREKEIIRRHMFPLTLPPPNSREGWIVCVADKVVSVIDYTRRKGK